MTSTRNLPPNAHQVLRDIADICSDAAALALVEKFAGQRLCIPRRMTPTHEIAEAIGYPLAKQVADGFCGEKITVPRHLTPSPRRMKVLELAREGLRVRDIAARAECTEMRVYQILAAERARTGRDPRRGPAPVAQFPRPNETETVSFSKSGPGTVVPFKDGGR